VSAPADLGDVGPHPLAPEAQLRPIVSGRACRTEFQNASAVWPDRMRPGGIGDGAGDHQRHAGPRLSNSLFDGEQRRLGVERVEDGLDQQQVGAAVEQAAICSP
jgi:hypothetical protein